MPDVLHTVDAIAWAWKSLNGTPLPASLADARRNLTDGNPEPVHRESRKGMTYRDYKPRAGGAV
jgi:hypothetical protein